MSQLTLLLIGSAGVDGLTAILTLLLLARRRMGTDGSATLGLLDLVMVAGATGTVFLMKAPLLGLLRVNLFGLISCLYIDLAVILPLTALLMLASPRLRLPGLGRLNATPPARAAAGLVLCVVPVAVYTSLVEPRHLRTERVAVPIPHAQPALSPLRIAVLADLQFRRVTAYERRAVELAQAERPDLILIPGDIFQGAEAAFEAHLPEIRTLLAGLSAPGGVFVVDGDTDSPTRLRRCVEGTEVRFLDNSVELLHAAGWKIALGGISPELQSPQVGSILRRLQTECASADVRLLLSHRPDAVLLLDQGSPVDLVVSGHTHGGQICLPGLGPLLTFSAVPRYAGAGGLSRINGHQLYVSRGVGCERGQALPMRFGCPPELTFLTLDSGR